MKYVVRENGGSISSPIAGATIYTESKSNHLQFHHERFDQITERNEGHYAFNYIAVIDFSSSHVIIIIFFTDPNHNQHFQRLTMSKNVCPENVIKIGYDNVEEPLSQSDKRMESAETQEPCMGVVMTTSLLWSPIRHGSCAFSAETMRLTVEACTSRALPDFNICNSTITFTQIEEDPPSKWGWRWPSLCRLDMERTGSVGEPLTDCAQEWAVQKQ